MTRTIEPKLGVCYYPEQWPEARWAEDARRMATMGIGLVRIGEFAWSRLEPRPGQLEFAWLERAVDCLAAAGLEVVLGTPTATPPKWLVDTMPEMLAVDAEGRRRGFGSRRHYCFSHRGYRAECRRIVTALAERFGRHPAIVAWQIDNEYGCHDTVLSFSEAARMAFRVWLAQRHGSVEALNAAWGNVFWSMEYGDFSEVELPNLTVTEANPAHWMDFRRFASDEVVSFNREQAEILRRLVPGRPLIHNYMGRSLDFDHFAVGGDLDIASWDSYPLGFLEDRIPATAPRKRRYARQGDPDFQAFHHDLYRAVGRGRWWVMEQQPGPVNWAPHNPAPLPGMLRLWAWEAVAHGAEAVTVFRWRQARFGQEQMHAGLERPDGSPAPGAAELAQVARELAALGPVTTERSPVALVFDYRSAWAWKTQPQGHGFDYLDLVLDAYRALRRLGLSVDILPPETESFAGYGLVLIPGLFAWTPALRAALAAHEGVVLIGPRSGAKTPDFAIPETLPPDLPAELLDLRVTEVESLRPDMPLAAEGGAIQGWREFVAAGPAVRVLRRLAEGAPLLLAQGRRHYLAAWPDESLWKSVIVELAALAGIATQPLPPGLRLRQAGNLTVALNYGPDPVELPASLAQAELGLGARRLEAGGVAILGRQRG